MVPGVFGLFNQHGLFTTCQPPGATQASTKGTTEPAVDACGSSRAVVGVDHVHMSVHHTRAVPTSFHHIPHNTKHDGVPHDPSMFHGHPFGLHPSITWKPWVILHWLETFGTHGTLQ